MTRADAQALVERLTADLADLERVMSEAWWDSNVAASPEAEARRVAAEQALSDRYAVAEDLAALQDAAASLREAPRAGGAEDAELARSVEVLRLAFAGEQLPVAQRAEMVRLGAEADSIYATFRGEAGGRRWSDGDITKVLIGSDDSAERQAAWEAQKQVGAAVADVVHRLVDVRNDAARALGHSDYYQMALALGELSEPRLFALLDELEALTDGPFRAMKGRLDEALAARFDVPVEELRPWHYGDPFFQDAPREAAVDLDPLVANADPVAATLRTYASLGIDVTEVIDRSDLWPREGKNQHAFCISVDRGDDVRVVANVVPGQRWISTMLHEFGHAAYDLHSSDGLPWSLRGPAHSLTTEAVAMLFERLAMDARWLVEVAGAEPSDVEAARDGIREAQRARALVVARWMLVMCHFERDLYAEHGTAGFDADARWWEHVARFQLVSPPPGRRAPDWAAKIHIAVAPVYYQNYVLGEMFASQLAASIKAQGRSLFDDLGTGSWMREAVFAPGRRQRWDRLVTEATGNPLSAAAFVAEFVTT